MGLQRLFCFYCGSHAQVEMLLMCGNCQSYHYCSKDCQKSDWGQHKLRCIRAAAASAKAMGKNPAARPNEDENEDQPKKVLPRKEQVKRILEQLEVKVRALDPLVEFDMKTGLKNVDALQQALKRRNETHQQIYHEVVDSLSAIMDVYDTSPKQQAVVLGNIIAAQRLYEQLHTGGLTGEQMPMDLIEQIYQKQQQAWTILELIIGVHPQTEEEVRKREKKMQKQQEAISTSLLYQTCSRAAFEFVDALEKFSATPAEQTPMGANFFDFVRDTTLGATSQTLREIIHCMGWGASYYERNLSDDEVEKEHNRTVNFIKNFASIKKDAPYWFQGTHFIAKSLLHLAEYVEKVSENSMLAEMSPSERRRFYEEGIWMMRLAASALVCGFGVYYVYGIKSKADADNDLNVLFSGRLNEAVFQNDTAEKAVAIAESKREETAFIEKEIGRTQARIDQATTTSMALKDDIMGSNAFLAQQFAQSVGADTQQVLEGVRLNRTTLLEDYINGMHQAGIGPNSTGYLNLHSEELVAPGEVAGAPVVMNTTDIAGHIRDLGLHFLHFCNKSLEERLAKDPKGSEIAQENRAALLTAGRANLETTRAIFLQDLNRAEKEFDAMKSQNYQVWGELLENLGRADVALAVGASKALSAHYDQIAADTRAMLGDPENPALNTLRFNYTQMQNDLTQLDDKARVLAINAATTWGAYQEYIRLENTTEKREAYKSNYPGEPIIGPITGDFMWILKNTFNFVLWQPWSMRYAGSHFAGAEVAWTTLQTMRTAFGANMMSPTNFANFASALFTMVMICNWYATVALLLVLPAVLVFLGWFLKRSNSLQNADTGSMLRQGRRTSHVNSEGSAMHAGAISSLLIDTKKTFEYLRTGFGLVSTWILGISSFMLVASDIILMVAAVLGGFYEAWRFGFSAGALPFFLNLGTIFATKGVDFLWATGTLIMHALMVVPLIRTRIPSRFLDKFSCLGTLVHYGAIGVSIYNINVTKEFMGWFQWFLAVSVTSYLTIGVNIPSIAYKGVQKIYSFVFWLRDKWKGNEADRVRLIESMSKKRSSSRSRRFAK
jgi:hypothetical protein